MGAVFNVTLRVTIGDAVRHFVTLCDSHEWAKEETPAMAHE
jgi:hypothetical protein